MSFSSPGFLFAFLPIFFFVYFGCPARIRNAVLLFGSLAFYTIDGGYVTIVLVASIVANQLIGERIFATASSRTRLYLLWIGIIINLVPLIYYKYWTFFVHVGNDILVPTGLGAILTSANIILPAGISFFTFQGLSYLVDIYRREIIPARSTLDFGMYHTLFPQLIAGPIVRYVEVQDRIVLRPIVIEDVEAGILRFCWGLAMKIIIADNMGSLADRVFTLPADQMTTTAAWIGALTYTLQIYFDFSGYSDMAIGLGRMLGFRFPENFDLPYRSRSITEFWRRWHMTLSRWFRDYVYIPLGGNRSAPLRTFVNLFVVFLLCGLWHGAAYTFIVWGCYHGFLLVVERFAGARERLPPLTGIVRFPLTLLLVIIGWVIFRSNSLTETIVVLKAMIGLGAATAAVDVLVFITPDKICFFLIGCFLSVVPVGRSVAWADSPSRNALRVATQRSLAVLLFVYSAALISANGFNPFIYFKF